MTDLLAYWAEMARLARINEAAYEAELADEADDDSPF